METSKIKNKNFYQIQGWMLNDLNLKGIQLHIFAIIYGFTQDGESEFSGGVQYLCDFTSTTKPTVINALKELVDKELIIKNEIKISSVSFNKYKTNLGKIDEIVTGKEILPVVKKFNPPGKKFLPPGKEILPNNKEINKNNNKKDNREIVVIQEFEKICPCLPKIKNVSEKRKRLIRNAEKILHNLGSSFTELFEAVSKSDFLTGKNQKWTGCNFDWILKPDNLTKIIEGNYKNSATANNTPQPRAAQIIREASYDLEELEKLSFFAEDMENSTLKGAHSFEKL